MRIGEGLINLDKTMHEKYKSLIDGMVEIRQDVVVSRIMEKTDVPVDPRNPEINEFVSALSANQRKLLSQMIQHARDGGIHDVFAYLNDEISLCNLRLVVDGRELPVEPFDTTLHYDWAARAAGDSWPDADEAES